MAVRATIRCYAGLNDLLEPDRRQRDVERCFEVAPSVKDAVEALGVPHTEVGLLVVDGEPVGFDHRLDHGQRVAVYPALTRLPVPEEGRLRPPPPRPVRVVTDVNVAALGRLLRLLGVDAAGGPHLVDDEALAAVSAAEDRVLLTRDRGLLKRRAVVHGLLVRADDPLDQAVDVVLALDLGDQLDPFTRCPSCNGVLDDVDPSVVAAQLEPGTRAAGYRRFRRCRSCGHAYWAGAHHRRLTTMVDHVRRHGRAPASPGHQDGVMADDPLERLRTICLDLPEVEERLSHGSPTFFVRGRKTLATFTDDHHGDGRVALCAPAPPGVQASLVEEEPERFFVPPYVGHRGWIGLRLDRDVDWGEVEGIVTDAYRLVAPKRLVALLDRR
jgi:uncharacterized protein